jgi:flagellar biosynthesis protein FlhB
MAEESFQERTEPATGKRRDEARSKGQVAKSMELNSAFVLVFGLLIMYLTGAHLVANLSDVMREMFSTAGSSSMNHATIQNLALRVFVKLGITLAPIMIGLMVTGVVAQYAQVGTLFSFEPMKPNWDKMNPLQGIKKVFISQRSMVEIAKNLVKTVVVGLVAYYALEGVMDDSVTLMDGDVTEVMGFMARAAVAVGLKTGLAFLVLAVIDYFYQRYAYEKGLRMTKEEVRQENKEMEGDPQVKGRIRSIQRRIAYRRMMHDVPKADVVVTNPTHLAVAIKYDSKKMSAPRVVAKGAGLIAQRIKEIAAEHNVPIVEDKPLARALFKTVEIGDEIPEKLFQAVAQVLAYIYRIKKAPSRFSMN